MKFCLAVITCALFSCSKKDGSEKDNQPPLITVQSPVDLQTFSGPQTVDISGSITDNVRIAELHVHIYNNNTGALLIDIHRTPAANSYTIKESFSAQANSSYKLQLIANDNSANQSIKTVNILVN